MRNVDYDNKSYNYQKNQNNNTVLIVLVSVLASILVIGIVVVALVTSGVLSFGANDNVAENNNAIVSTEEMPTEKGPEIMVKQPVPVDKTMYIGNCNVSVTLRTGPGTNFDEIRQIPIGAAVYVIEYTTDEFALVTYDSNKGYVMRNYIVSTQPQVWYYDEEEVEGFVGNSLYAFVYGINTGDTDYVYEYFSGSAAEQEMKSRNQIDDAVYSEEILSLNCHSVKRISPSRVTCIRESVIRVTYNDLSIKDITERYKYTVDLSSGRMYIVALEQA